MKATGIYFTNGTVRVTELAGSRRNPRLTRTAEGPVAPGKGPGEALARILAESGISGAHASVCLPGEGAVVRRLVVPVSNQRGALRAVRFQAEELLCGDSLEDVVIEHEVIGPTPDGGTEMLVMAVRKTEVAKALAMLAEAGLEPAGVTLDGAALFNLASASGAIPRTGRCAVLDIEASILRILVTRDGKVETCRTARLPASSDGCAAEAAVRELERTLAGTGVQDPLEKILVSGVGSEEMAPSLSSRFLMPAEILDASRAFGGDGESGTVSGIASGTALKGLGAEALSVDFRKEEFAPPGDSRKVYFLALYALGSLAVLFGILLAGALRDRSAASGQLERLVAEEKKEWKRVFPTKPFPRVGFDRYIMTLKGKPGGRKSADPEEYASLLEALNQASEALPGEGVQVQAISFDQQKLVIAGEVEDMDVFETLVNRLSAGFGVEVKPRMERRGKPGKGIRTVFKIEIPHRKETRE